MTNKDRNDLCEEAPHWDTYQIIIVAVYLTIGVLDAFVFQFSTFLINYVHFIIPIILGASTFAIGAVFMYLSHKVVFEEVRDPPRVIDWNVFRFVRHPMYFGILLFYLAFMLFTFSLICLGLFIVICFIYNKFANYEENQLELKYKEKYIEYKNKTPKWIPH
jgi:protein-S-isoprenylcysteine O-methyltransferase Ste14